MSEFEASVDGGCFCRALRYRLTSRPMFVHCCHCRDCQKQTGTAFVLNAIIERDRIIQIAGEPAPVAVPTDSGRRTASFVCGVPVGDVERIYGALPALRFVRVGTLDEPAPIAPDVHIFTRSKLPWVTLPPTFPPSKPITTGAMSGPPRARRGGAPHGARRAKVSRSIQAPS
jgi:hypothetical protein